MIHLSAKKFYTKRKLFNFPLLKIYSTLCEPGDLFIKLKTYSNLEMDYSVTLFGCCPSEGSLLYSAIT